MVNRRFCSLSNLHRISFVSACEKTCTTVCHSVLESQRGGWLPRRPKFGHLVLPSVTSPCRPPCAVLTRPARYVSGFWTRQVSMFVPGHALHKNSSQRQIGVDIQVSSQEQRVLLVLVINRWSTGCFFLRRFLVRIGLFVLSKIILKQLSSSLWWTRETYASWANRTVDVPFRPAIRSPAPIRPWYVRILDSAGLKAMPKGTCSRTKDNNQSSQKPEHTTGGSGQGAR